MRIGDFAEKDLRSNLLRSGFKIHLGPFTAQIQADGPAVFYRQFLQLNTEHRVADGDAIADFHIGIARPRGIRRWLRPQVKFHDDRVVPFEPFPAYMALAVLEWGINWCISNQANQFLMLHSAVVERDGIAIVLPAHSGHGKTTLCAGLMLSGWRLLSDEFGLVQPLTSTLVPLPRLLPLKNQSIEVIRAFSPHALLGPTFPKTKKGDVAHLKPTAESVERSGETAQAGLIVFPRWQLGARLQLSPMPKSNAFLALATNSFNYEVLGEAGFRTVDHLIAHRDCYRLVYSNLSEAVTALSELAGKQ